MGYMEYTIHSRYSLWQFNSEIYSINSFPNFIDFFTEFQYLFNQARTMYIYHSYAISSPITRSITQFYFRTCIVHPTSQYGIRTGFLIRNCHSPCIVTTMIENFSESLKNPNPWFVVENRVKNPNSDRYITISKFCARIWIKSLCGQNNIRTSYVFIVISYQPNQFSFYSTSL